ncbi:Uncharacterised protein [Mycobacteroides abscessus]|nr:Uncharacterised protein [Mycobacteroides abscessus]
MTSSPTESGSPDASRTRAAPTASSGSSGSSSHASAGTPSPAAPVTPHASRSASASSASRQPKPTSTTTPLRAAMVGRPVTSGSSARRIASRSRMRARSGEREIFSSGHPARACASTSSATSRAVRPGVG